MSPARRRQMVDREHPKLPIVRQCAPPPSRGAGSAGGDPFQRLLPSQGGLGSGPVPDGRERPAVPGNPILRVAADEGLAGEAWSTGEPEAGAAADAGHGATGHLTEAWHQPTGVGGQGLSVPVEERQDHPAQPGVGGGHHLPSHGPGLPLHGGNHGLAQPVRGGLAAVQHTGSRLLRRGAGPWEA